ncbi:hypothetical protein Py04_0526 [Pyrococcus sp. ST04]|nr:hypothetical protein Py04_0526 [Pyrococcus sp. ST04]
MGFLGLWNELRKISPLYEGYLGERTSRGIYDLWKLNLIPKLNIYRRDLIPKDLAPEKTKDSESYIILLQARTRVT